MQEQDSTLNGSDKANGSNGAVHEPLASQAPVPSRERPPIAPRSYERSADAGAISLDSLRSMSGSPGAKLQSTTRVLNAFNGYLMNACGRQPDQMTEADMTALGQIMAILERLEGTKRSGFPN